MVAERRRRTMAVCVFALAFVSGVAYQAWQNRPHEATSQPQVAGVTTGESQSVDTTLASAVLDTLDVKGRAPKTGYKRALFGNGWSKLGACDVRNRILARDLTDVVFRSETDCTVLSGTLNDPYTGTVIQFTRGSGTSSLVQIDHVVALSDAWQKGAQQLSESERLALANDPLNLLAVDGAANQKKSDSDAASWLPSNKLYRCRYVARQIAVKVKYTLWVTQAEHDAMKRVLTSCPDQPLPLVGG